jgi:hypothetical protein
MEKVVLGKYTYAEKRSERAYNNWLAQALFIQNSVMWVKDHPVDNV